MVRTLLTILLLLSTCIAYAEGMKLVRFGEKGSERPGLLDAAGKLRDLSAHISDITPETIGRLTDLARIDPGSLPLVEGEPRLGSPISRAGKIVAVGFNYRDHAEETGTPIPTEPVLFMKSSSALSGPFDNIVQPRGSTALDYEAELAIIIGREARYVAKADAASHIAGFAVGHDVSERDFQRLRGGQFVKGKSADTFAPLGPYLITPAAIDNVQNLAIFSIVNGQRRQNSNTRHMIFSAEFIVSYVSQFMTLQPGDVIFTGTPSGVGSAMTPPQYLLPGDVVEIGIEELGRQRQTIVAAP